MSSQSGELGGSVQGEGITYQLLWVPRKMTAQLAGVAAPAEEGARPCREGTQKSGAREPEVFLCPQSLELDG